MPNTFAPIGFVHQGVGGGTAPNFELDTRKIALGNATKIFRGDPVKQLSTGYIAQWTAGTSAALFVGTFVGCRYRSVATGKTVWSNYWPGADAAIDPTAYIIPTLGSPATRFVVQSSGTAITLADVGANIDVTLGAGNTLTQLSTAAADQTTINTTATLPFKIVGLYTGIDNGSDAASSFNKIIVQANVGVSVGI